MKKEYNKIHERYTELLRSHCDLMERVKIMFGNEDQAASGTGQQQPQPPQSSLSTLAGTFRANLARFGSQEAEEGGGTASFQATSTELYGQPQRSSAIDLDGSQRTARQAWTNNANFETEMSYDDTTTIIEDVEELQKTDKEKELRDRDHSLSGRMLKFVEVFCRIQAL